VRRRNRAAAVTHTDPFNRSLGQPRYFSGTAHTQQQRSETKSPLTGIQQTAGCHGSRHFRGQRIVTDETE
jgi:hypothetical protein